LLPRFGVTWTATADLRIIEQYRFDDIDVGSAPQAGSLAGVEHFVSAPRR
jgi:hypothetical protein